MTRADSSNITAQIVEQVEAGYEAYEALALGDDGDQVRLEDSQELRDRSVDRNGAQVGRHVGLHCVLKTLLISRGVDPIWWTV